MLEFYEGYKPRKPEKMVILKHSARIIADYQGEGLMLTLRQLYYQLVTKNIIPNKPEAYDELGDIVSRGRRGGILEWGMIEDRVRQPKVPQDFESLDDLMDIALRAYRLPRMKGQEQHIELWVEKDALAGVLAPIANRYHITLMVNKGYSSTSAMKEAGERVREGCDKLGNRKAMIFYLGDFDPSGEDMVRDISQRLDEYTNRGIQFRKDPTSDGGLRAETREERQKRLPFIDIEVEKIALTMEQIEEYDPPPNPAKVQDPRAKKFIEEHGESSWEVDALPPSVLRDIIETRLDEVINNELVDEIKFQEEQDKKRLKEALAEVKQRGEKSWQEIAGEVLEGKRPDLDHPPPKKTKSKKKATKKRK